MLTTLAIENYRSIIKLVLPLGQLNLVTGANGAGKSNLYKALRLLASAAGTGLPQAIAQEGGLDSVFWAGEKQKAPTRQAERYQRLRLGFSTDDYSYAAILGLPAPSQSLFGREPELKFEALWHGAVYRPASSLLLREGALIKSQQHGWQVLQQHCPTYSSIFDQVADPVSTPEVFSLREYIRSWRFYDHFRTDPLAPARQAHCGSRTPVLHHDGHNLASALQTIIEIGDVVALNQAIDLAFPGCRIAIVPQDNYFHLHFFQPGFKRHLTAMELSDGTLRYLLWVAALLTPRPPALMILNEPESSLHPELLPALAKLIQHACQYSQLWVVSHAQPLISLLAGDPRCQHIALTKEHGATTVPELNLLNTPAWYWPD